jgi:hypothetical protein
MKAWYVKMCGIRRWMLMIAAACVAITIAQDPMVEGQLPSLSGQVHHTRGQSVVPVYEGWYRTPDGATHVSFGYLNRNYEETLDIPVGPDNRIEPGPADQGQPTHFLPRRQRGVFAVALPKDRPTTEIVWTLTIRGRTESVPANLSNLYMIDALSQVGGTTEGASPPVLRLDPAGPPAVGHLGHTIALTTRASRPLPLEVWVADQGQSDPPDTRAPNGASMPGRSSLRPRMSVIWSKYRGTGNVHFSNARPPVEQGTADTAATIAEPGEYMLRVAALRGSNFGGQCCWTNGYVKVTVGPAEPPK